MKIHVLEREQVLVRRGLEGAFDFRDEAVLAAVA